LSANASDVSPGGHANTKPSLGALPARGYAFERSHSTPRHLTDGGFLATPATPPKDRTIIIAHCNTTPFDNNDLRLALKYAVDREEMVQKILGGYGTVGNDNPIAPTVRYATNPEPVHQFDPERARYHLRKAGLESLSVDLSTAETAFPGAIDAAVLIREQAAQAGIDINVVRDPSDGYWDNVWMVKPFIMSYWGGRPTADWMFSTAYAADAAWNDTYWSHDRFNELLIAARAETDEAQRAAMYAEMQQIVHNDGGAIVLMFANFVSAHSTAVAHGDLNSNWDIDGGWIFERWWFV
jgi:peptide/nickel transport system substrate-binding protein